MGALDGIKVLDLSRVLAGPFCGQMLADNGAEVIKVESPDGDLNRGFPHAIGDGQTSNWLCVNRGKKDITLNLKSPKALELLDALATTASAISILTSFIVLFPDMARRAHCATRRVMTPWSPPILVFLD